ncbi:MAG: DUF6876 family protein [Methanoregulaceae archaeon]
MISAEELESSLSHFTGTSQYFRDPLTKLIYTEGIRHLVEQAGANWLLTDIGAVFRYSPKVRDMGFQLWTLVVNPDATALLTCKEDCDMPVLYEQKYGYTDFPVGTWKMYLYNDVLMVPSEY